MAFFKHDCIGYCASGALPEEILGEVLCWPALSRMNEQLSSNIELHGFALRAHADPNLDFLFLHDFLEPSPRLRTS